MERQSTTKLLLIAFVLSVIAFFLLEFSATNASAIEVTSFEACAAAGYPIMESFPEQCRTPEGKTFVRAVEQNVSLPFSSEDQPSACVISNCDNTCVSKEEAEAESDKCDPPKRFACYAHEICRVLPSGKCGWVENEELRRCLAEVESQNTR